MLGLSLSVSECFFDAFMWIVEGRRNWANRYVRLNIQEIMVPGYKFL
jgi:hypothetical protein